MKITQRISILMNILLLSACLLLGLRSGRSASRPLDVAVSMPPAAKPANLDNGTVDSSDPTEAFAMRAPFVTGVPVAYPITPPGEVVVLLESKRAAGQTDHRAFLVEYGLRVHQKCLEYSRLARKLNLENNMMLAELVRLAEISPYKNAHEAGWLNSQFEGEFSGTGYSSYQIYIWAKEHTQDTLSYPNWRRIGEIMDAIDKSGLNGVGGGMVCHYGCVP